MKRKVVALLVVVGAVLGTARLHAHHAASSEFDGKQSVTIEGTIFKVELTNPHGWIYMKVLGPDGKVEIYSVQTSAPTQLIRRGGDKKTLAIGTTIIVGGWPARDGSKTMNGRTIKTADGKIIAGDTAQ